MVNCRITILLLLCLGILMLFGCSGSGDALLPSSVDEKAVSGDSESHQLWGLYTFIAHPDKGQMEIIPMRGSQLHLNALPLLEQPGHPSSISIDSLIFSGDQVDVVIGIRHPYLGLQKFTGFDVSGIVFSHGSVSGFFDPELIMAGPGDTRLLNKDGLSRWWNPAEFPHGYTISNYVNGALGTPANFADYNTTLNGYKYYADGLAEETPLDQLDISKRGMFSAGAKHVRLFQIDLSGGLIFNYAIDANWKAPIGDPPYQVPDDFGEDANRPEAYRIETAETGNTLYYDSDTQQGGGALNILIHVYDWFGSELNTVKLESRSGLPQTTSDTPVGGGIGYSTYEMVLNGDGLTESGTIDLLFTIESDDIGYGGLLPGKPVSSYFTGTTEVESIVPPQPSITVDIPNGGETWGINSNHDIEWSSTGAVTDVKIEYSKDNFSADNNEIVASTPNDGLFDWLVPDDPSGTVRVRITDVTDALVTDTSDADFTIIGGLQLIFPDPPVQLSDSSYQNCTNRGPGVIIDADGDAVISWGQTPENQLNARPVDRMSNDNGANWNSLDTFPVYHYSNQDGYLTGTKMVLDANGDAYALDMWVDNDNVAFWWNYIIRCPFDSDDDWGWQMTSSFRGVEVATTSDGYLLSFEDYDWFYGTEKIYVVRSDNPNDPTVNGSDGHSWYHLAYYLVADEPALLSTGPSIQRDSSGVNWLAYQNGENADEIRMVNNANGTGISWNSSSPLMIGQAVSPDTGCQDPTVWLDPDGGMHLGYITYTSSPTYSYIYNESTTGDPNDFGTEEIVISGLGNMAFPTVQCSELPVGRAPTIAYEGDGGIFCAWRNPGTGTWSAEIEVDSGATSTEPSMWVDQANLYVHIVWAEEDIDGRYQIWYRRGEFVGQ